MSSFTQVINFIMGLIDLIKKFFGGTSGDTPQPDNGDNVVEEQ